ncbi:MAG: TraB/GumN family protein [Treponema sp.]|jgi:pheromone shutdown protein TraB|nr:TraB/GumN family protein [Treponema sp.]
MNDTRLTVNLGNREIILIGTAHISRESIDEVSRVIREEKPSHVCVELDAGRHAAMTQKDNWEKLDMVKVFREGKGFLLIANLVLTGFQRRMGSELGVKPGEEMKRALETAGELGIPHSLCDREIQLTLRRAWACCSFWNKCKLLAALLSSAFVSEKMSSEEIENLKKRNELDGMMSELAEFLPGVKKALIDERDQYLAAKIWSSIPPTETAPQTTPFIDPSMLEAMPLAIAPVMMPPAPLKRRIVAIVGAGHMEGIKAHLEKLSAGKESPDTRELESIPPRSGFSRAAGFIIPAALIALLALIFFMGGMEKFQKAGMSWILWNGSLAALGTILALGHPLAILVAFLGAPVTSLTPVIGVGILTGLVQASLCKPRVMDAESIADDISSLKGIYRNRISRALLVFFLSSMGSSVGTFVSISSIASYIPNLLKK